MNDWIECTDRLPSPGQIVSVISLNWDRPRQLRYEPVQPEGFVDDETRIRYWYPERMKWRAVSESLPHG